jgi:hypothetical protein
MNQEEIKKDTAWDDIVSSVIRSDIRKYVTLLV